MSLLEKFTDLFKKDRIIHLDGEVQDDGYLYVYSNDLKGFSLMLEPDQWKDFGSLIQSVEIPLLAYIDAYEDAKKSIGENKKQVASRYEVFDFSKKSNTSYCAKVRTGLNHC